MPIVQRRAWCKLRHTGREPSSSCEVLLIHLERGKRHSDAAVWCKMVQVGASWRKTSDAFFRFDRCEARVARGCSAVHVAKDRSERLAASVIVARIGEFLGEMATLCPLEVSTVGLLNHQIGRSFGDYMLAEVIPVTFARCVLHSMSPSSSIRAHTLSLRRISHVRRRSRGLFLRARSNTVLSAEKPELGPAMVHPRRSRRSLVSTRDLRGMRSRAFINRSRDLESSQSDSWSHRLLLKHAATTPVLLRG